MVADERSISNDWMQNQVRQTLQRVVCRLVEEHRLPEAVLEVDITVEKPRDPSHGDVATNAALVFAKPARRSPREVASVLQSGLEEAWADDEYVTAVEIAGPGFLNIRLGDAYRSDLLLATRQSGYGWSRENEGRRVLVEFVSANPTGPMLVVQARAAALGDVLCNLLERTGYEVGREYYVNDAGVQIERLGQSLEVRIRELQGASLPFPEDGYPGAYLIEAAQVYCQAHSGSLPQSNSALWQELGRFAADFILAQQRDLLERYGVVFDHWYRESRVRSEGAPEAVLEELRQRGYLQEEEGALWLRSTAFGDDKDRVLVKSDGSYTYLLPDLAYHKGKYDRGYHRLIDIWGPDHHGYIARMGAGLQALGYPADGFEVLISQWVRLLRDGQEISMSKRSGTFITMEELLDEVGRDAARFFFLMRSPTSPLDFDMELAKTQSNENPVYYAQYAHARIHGVLDTARDRGVSIPTEKGLYREDLTVLIAQSEQALIRRLGDFSGEVQGAAQALEPHRLAAYVLDVASLFHAFYTECRVLTDDEKLTQGRLYLCAAAAGIIRQCLDLLGVSAPEQM